MKFPNLPFPFLLLLPPLPLQGLLLVLTPPFLPSDDFSAPPSPAVLPAFPPCTPAAPRPLQQNIMKASVVASLESLSTTVHTPYSGQILAK